jgi:hypothetical protein
MEADGAARRAQNPLSDHFRVEIMRRRALKHSWADIAKDPSHSESTIRSLFMKQEQSGCFQKMMDCPRALDSSAAVIELTRAEPCSTVRDGPLEWKLYHGSQRPNFIASPLSISGKFR